MSILVLFGKFRVRLRAAKRDLPFDPGGGNKTFEMTSLRAFADDAQSERETETRDCRYQHVEPFFFYQPSDSQ